MRNQKLNVLGSVYTLQRIQTMKNTLDKLFIKDLKLNTAYLSLTRGDGGQNLIGSDLDEKLGVILVPMSYWKPVKLMVAVSIFLGPMILDIQKC